MRPLTLEVPKSMLLVAGRPFVDWQLEKLAACGFGDVVMCVAHLGEQIEAHVADGAKLGVRVRYSREGETLLGTGGALRAAIDMLQPTFLVTYGDSYLPFDYDEPLATLDRHEDCDGVMSVFKNAGQWDASNVETDSGWVKRYEKGGPDSTLDHIDYGALALRRSVILGLAPGVASSLSAVQTELARAHKMRAVVAAHRFYEIGSREGLAELDRALSGESS